MERIDPRAAAAALDQYWSQKVLGEANGSLFKVAKGTGSTNWHAHDDQDEVFVVLKGHLTMQLRTGDVELDEGDMFIVPRGVEHCPKADAEVHLMLVGRRSPRTRRAASPTGATRPEPDARRGCQAAPASSSRDAGACSDSVSGARAP